LSNLPSQATHSEVETHANDKFSAMRDANKLPELSTADEDADELPVMSMHAEAADLTYGSPFPSWNETYSDDEYESHVPERYANRYVGSI
jgi:hypothetical protein